MRWDEEEFMSFLFVRRFLVFHGWCCGAVCVCGSKKEFYSAEDDALKWGEFRIELRIVLWERKRALLSCWSGVGCVFHLRGNFRGLWMGMGSGWELIERWAAAHDGCLLFMLLRLCTALLLLYPYSFPYTLSVTSSRHSLFILFFISLYPGSHQGSSLFFAVKLCFHSFTFAFSSQPKFQGIHFNQQQTKLIPI